MTFYSGVALAGAGLKPAIAPPPAIEVGTRRTTIDYLSTVKQDVLTGQAFSVQISVEQYGVYVFDTMD